MRLMGDGAAHKRPTSTGEMLRGLAAALGERDLEHSMRLTRNGCEERARSGGGTLCMNA